MNNVKRLLDIFKEQGCPGFLYRISNKIFARNQSVTQYLAPTVRELDEMRRVQSEFSYRPLISIVMPVFNTDPELLKEAIESVLSQLYPNIELCIADDASTLPAIAQILKDYLRRDSRIKVVFRKENGQIAQASQSALDLTQGEYVALLDHDDLLPPHAIARVVQELQSDQKCDVLYTDEAKVKEDGEIVAPSYKPDWNKHYFYSYMYTGHLTVYRTQLIKKVGGFRNGYEGSQDYDLMLRILEHHPDIIHIPEVLYYWRMSSGSVSHDRFAKPYAYQNARKALTEHFLKEEEHFKSVDSTIYPGVTRASCSLQSAPSVTLVSLSALFTAKYHEPTQEKYIFISDNDFWPRSREWVEVMAQCLAFKAVGAVTPRMVCKKSSTLVAAGGYIDNGRLFYDFQGLSCFDPGRGMQAVTQREVAAAPLKNLLLCSTLWNSFWRERKEVITNRDALACAIFDFIHASGKMVLYTPYVEFYC